MQTEMEVVLSKLTANRAEFFEHVEELEKLIGRDVNTIELQATIDCEFSGRSTVNEREGLMILLRAHGKPALRAVG